MSMHLKARPPARIALITDDRVGPLYADTVRSILDTAGLGHMSITVPQGEKSKSFLNLEYLCREMAKAGLDRDALVLALGGGVVGDLAGLTASTYLRGVPFYQVPTSLLAMVDSSVGGKTGINIPEGKNLVGTFYQPEGVYAETGVLKTLDTRDWYSGLAEAVKIALTMDEEFFGYIESLPDLRPDGGLDVSRIVLTACLRKADVVRQDEKESGFRRVLNFGHTLGHAIEAALGYGKIRHGEAVALGMRAALSLSVDRCGLPSDHYSRAIRVLEKIPVPDIETAADGLLSYLERDKKSARGAIQAVLISGIGHYEFVPLRDPMELVEALKRTEAG
jgi:3-dehydroquinate synthase